MKTSEIRSQFLNFFHDRGHLLESSASLVPASDPTLLFTTAGMVPFKAYFAGVETPPCRRIATVQKSLRAGGKGSDLENVGFTDRHHTFFEMLGNFSFGDYFKQEAIRWAWEFVTGVVRIPPERLWASIYLDDDEAFGFWHRDIGLPAARIVRLGKKDNFWGPAGDSGACGPSSEIYIDQGPERAVQGPEAARCTNPECRPGCDCERYLEFWNLVFNQFYQEPDGSQRPLPLTGVDTGMGLERLAVIVQGVRSPYETDLLADLGRGILELVPGPLPAPLPDAKRFPLNVVIDHVRALTFAISDGVIPSNEGRGYVLRRILRRAVRFAKRLGVEEPFMFRVVHRVVSLYEDAYPELRAHRGHVESTIKAEEERFHHTLRQGMDRLLEFVEELKIAHGRVLSGDQAFLLYDTFGFPVDLTREILEEHQRSLDEERFAELMEERKVRSRSQGMFAGGDVGEGIDPEVLREYGGAFMGAGCAPGRQELEAQGRFTLLTGPDPDGLIRFLLRPTPFYPEGGGQVGDRGTLTGDDFHVEVLDATHIGGIVVHVGRFSRAPESARPLLEVLRGVAVTARVSRAHRLATARHHTATHVLHAALRRQLGAHVRQAGSLVTPDRLRFDFSHGQSIAPEVLRSLEEEVNDVILTNHAVEGREMEFDEAIRAGALAFFGDKYGKKVRTVRIAEYSFELCGGTHVGSTGEIGLFTFTGESSVAAGTRRVEALTGGAARTHLRKQLDRLDEITQTLKIPENQVVKRLESLMSREKELARKVKDLQMKLATGAAAEGPMLTQVDGIGLACKNLGEMDMAALRGSADQLMQKLGADVVLLGSHQEGKVFLVAKVAPSAGKALRAGDLIKPIAAEVGGSGGGRPDMAQAGGTRPELLDAALERVPEVLRSLMKSGS